MTERKNRSEERITIGNVTRTIKGWARYRGISRTTIYTRRHNGMTGADLVAPNKKPETGVTAWGRTQSMHAWSREKKIPVNTIWYRLRVVGVSPEMALSTPSERKGRVKE